MEEFLFLELLLLALCLIQKPALRPLPACLSACCSLEIDVEGVEVDTASESASSSVSPAYDELLELGLTGLALIRKSTMDI